MPMNKLDGVPEGYLYISHLDEGFKFWRLPVLPDAITDSMTSQFSETNALGRSAPVYTFSHSGPRTVQVDLKMRRDMMDDVNAGYSNVQLADDEDYIENLIRALQSISVPKYNLNNRAIEPPLVAVRLANQIFVKGVVTSSIGLTYNKPLLCNNKYAEVTLSFTVSEVDPYDATTIFENGSYRGVVKTLKNSGMGYAEEDR